MMVIMRFEERVVEAGGAGGAVGAPNSNLKLTTRFAPTGPPPLDLVNLNT